VDFAEGLRARDPKRVAVYFCKHSSFKAKDYQNRVPEQWQQPGGGPGRFWGYWVLRPAVAAVELTPEDATTAARTLRRWARAQGTTREASVLRGTRRRKVRRRVRRFGDGRGFVVVNDGPSMVAYLARVLEPP
jgi:hypothetical protein